MADIDVKQHIWCRICELKTTEKTASIFCPECDQALCSDCDLQHKFSKSSDEHVTVPIEQFSCLPSFVKDVELFCNEHGKPFVLYCPDHKEPICVMSMVVTHRCCSSILPLQQVMGNLNKAEMLDDYSDSIVNACQIINKIREERVNSVSKFKNDIVRTKKIFVTLQKNIKEYLDEIECQIVNSLNVSYKEYEDRSNKLVMALSENEMVLQKVSVDIQKTKENATLLQSYLASPYIDNLISEKEVIIRNLIRSNPLNQIEINETESLASFDVKTKMMEASFDDKFGVKEIPSYIDYENEKTKHAQLSVIPQSIEHIMLEKEIDIHFIPGDDECNIVGCAIGPTGEFVFCDYSQNRRLLVFHNTGIFERLIKTDGKPCCLTFIDKNTITVTFGDSGEVDIRNFFNGDILVRTKLDENSVGIGYVDKYLYVRTTGHIYKIDLSGKIKETFELDFGTDLHFSIKGKSIVAACCGGVCWLDLNMKLRKEYLGNAGELEGIAIDKHGNVYASLYKTNAVVVIAQNGTRHEMVLCEDDGIVLPTGICFNKSFDKVLIVTSSLNHAKVYTVGRK